MRLIFQEPISRLQDQMQEEGFTKTPSKSAPSVTYEKGDIGISIYMGYVHCNEAGLKYIMENGYKFKRVNYGKDGKFEGYTESTDL